jgi:hypothetical protein
MRPSGAEQARRLRSQQGPNGNRDEKRHNDELRAVSSPNTATNPEKMPTKLITTWRKVNGVIPLKTID